MKTLLALPFKIFALISAIFEKGPSYCLGYLCTYIYLSLVERLSRKRFLPYDLVQDTDPEKNGFFVPRHEYALEAPKVNTTTLNETADDVFCYGVNSSSDGLVVHVSRLPNGQVRCSLFLKLADGREFCLPEEHLLQQESTEEMTFGSSRLKLQCLLPMRKWRIFFNGILKERSPSENILPKYRHVSFAFIFTASSDVYDFTRDFSKDVLLRNSTASASWTTPPIFIAQRMKNIMNSYEQSGMLLGTMKIEDDEPMEMFLWGNRGHHMGRTRNLERGQFTELYGSFQNGALIHLGFLSLPGFRSKFQYGYVMRSDGFIYPIEAVSTRPLKPIEGETKLQFSAGGTDYEFQVLKTLTSNVPFQKEFNGSSFTKYADMTISMVGRCMKGKGFIFNGTISELSRSEIPIPVKEKVTRDGTMLTIPFEDSRCQNSSLTGGKGSSLGMLYAMANPFNKRQRSLTFEVPNGFVITTEAYNLFTRGNLHQTLQRFQDLVWSRPPGDSKELCQRAVEEVTKSKLPEKIRISIENSLKHVFLDGYANKKFAVRSSATGEDTEQMSAAGQMETFLGLKTLDQILEAVKKCWASQFAFQAVEYKRRYGQLLNAPMAVVVQEMVPCEVAGVTFTCDPVTGNPTYVNITANYGLGESVVSASSEPDTVVLQRSVTNRVKLHSYQVGKKQTKIIMNAMVGDSGTQEIAVEGENSTMKCLSDEMALKLGQIAVKIEEHYGSSRDLEWGIVGDKVFLFQSRPITSIDADTDFEAIHFTDTYMRTEKEYFSKANVGEVMPGATSPLGLDVMLLTMLKTYEKQSVVRFDGAYLPYVPYFYKRICSTSSHIFFNLLDGFLRFEELNSEITDALMLSLFGRHVNDKEMTDAAYERHKAYNKDSIPPWREVLFSTVIKYIAGILTRRRNKELKTLNLSFKSRDSLLQRLYHIGKNYNLPADSMLCHMYTSISSSNWNMSIMSLLASAKGDWDNDVYSDFSYLLSTCTEVESADVPAAIQKLGHTISHSPDANKFKTMSTEGAETFLKTSKSTAGVQFRDFLMKHGHRCVKEFDMISIPWEDDPKPVIKMIQDFVNPNVKDATHKKEPSFDEILSKMAIKLGFVSRMKLRWMLPNCRRGVREREFSKSMLIKSYHMFRKMLQELSSMLVREGRLPQKDLIFFLLLEEINQLIRTRSPKLIARALKRKKFYKELDQLKFPEIFSGLPKPVNFNEQQTNGYTPGLTMTGVPVSQGIVKGTARVVKLLSEAVNIKSGDILIAYSTDIGWSPYFPLLSGVVTELGGLISHGAVVAREYGLPCVVALHDATIAFKSGDTVILDGNKGTLTRVDD